MTDVNIELVKLQTAAEIRRAELQAEVKKVVYGSFLLGVAVALFPVISAWIEHRFNLRIEETKQVNQLKLQENQLQLDLQKLVQEVEAAKTKASFESTQSDRKFFEDISDEARSANLSDRITIAEFFTFLATTQPERDQWKLFRDRLLVLQVEFNSERTRLMKIIADPNSSNAAVQEAIAKLRQIGERESGVGVLAGTAWTRLMPLGSLDPTFGKALKVPGSGFLLEHLGRPADDPGQDCGAVTNPARVKADNPDLYGQIGTAGGLCVRLVRGSTTTLSNHSWGIAIDITIGEEMDVRGDGMAQAGLVDLAMYFVDEGWVWGAGFPTEESMHFEVSQEKLQEWFDAGLLAPKIEGAIPPAK